MPQTQSDVLSAAQEVRQLLEAAINMESKRFALRSEAVGAGNDKMAIFVIAQAGKPPTFPLSVSVRPSRQGGDTLHVEYQYINVRTRRSMRGVEYASSRAKLREQVRAFVSAAMDINLPK